MHKTKTPLRYPGGKQRLTPFINEILIANNLVDAHYVEPYAGGAGVAMELLLSKKVSHVHLNDSNVGIYAFWSSILNHTEEFCRLISSASLNVNEWKRKRDVVRLSQSENMLELGFSIFYLNRCNRSGVLSAGLIGGQNQDGNYKMDARFSRNDLIRRIEAIATFKNSITVTNLDAEVYITEQIPTIDPNCLIYFDPPYYEKSHNLYLDTYKKADHVRLSKVIQQRRPQKWVLSYDYTVEIARLYEKRRKFIYDLQYSAANTYKGKEVFIFGDYLKLPKESSLSYIDLALKSKPVDKTILV